MTLWNDLGRWPVIYEPPAGSTIEDVAALVLQAAQVNSLVRGFLFNDVLVRVLPSDTALAVVERYRQSPERGRS